jgi:peptidyl-prolyl cis-trans isomerase A (cyclophilin A)
MNRNSERSIPAVWLIIILITTACKDNTVVTIRTDIGNIDVILYQKMAPVTVGNFLNYVDSGLFDECSFYRVVNSTNQPNDSVKIAVIQGGRRDTRTGGFPPIAHESTGKTGILHRNGTISMARARVGSASSEFFICIGDQPELDYGGKRNPDGEGFAAFGKVINGMAVVEAIHKLPAERQYLAEPVIIRSIMRRQKR